MGFELIWPSASRTFQGFFLPGPHLTPVGKHSCKRRCEKPASELKTERFDFFPESKDMREFGASLVSKKI